MTAGGNGLSSSSSYTTPGFPPPQAPTGGLSAGPESGGVLRQTATGWRDESHELNPVGGQEGSFVYLDLPYRPDPIFAVLVDPTGTQGWAVGGISDSEDEAVETADIERYPADGVTPLGAGASPVASPGPATFAFGGEALCAAPCSDRAHAGVGPQVWLRSALALADRVGESSGGHLGAFFDTGPTVTAGTFVGAKSPPIPFADELDGSASIFSSSAIPVYDTITPDDLDARPEQDGSEATWEAAFAAFPGRSAARGAAGPAEEPTRCGASPGCESAYYAVEKEGVWVLVLDDSQQGDVNQAQREWVERRLGAAGAEAKPVIVVGNANLGAQVAAHDIEAAGCSPRWSAKTPTAAGDPGHYVASAYFYDSPEANVQEQLNYNGAPARGVRVGHARLRAARHTRTRATSTARRASCSATSTPTERKAERRSAGVGAADPRDRRTGARSGQWDAAAPQQRVAVRRARAPPARGLPGERTNRRVAVPGRPVHADPLAVRGDGLPDGRAARIRTRILGQGSGPLRRAQHRLQQPATKCCRTPKANRSPTNGKRASRSAAQSGLFCAFNPGTTTVTIRAGGLSASLPVTVEAGSVREPCGTVPLKPRPLPETAVEPAAAASPRRASRPP